MKKIPVIAVVGATATGKSDLAMRLAFALGGEIISGDSMQIYKGMDLGTAKPSLEERAIIPHHLIDIADITEVFSAATFIEKATEAAKDITKRGKIPIIAGGTGLYIDLLLSGRTLVEMESQNDLRKELYEKAEKEGNEALHAYLKSFDPESAENIHPNNVKRVVRALEIYFTSGLTKTRQDEISKQSGSIFDYTLIYLTSSDRQILYDRINSRVDKMLKSGLEDEVKTLYSAGLANTVTASQAIGYKEFFPYFEQKADLETVVEDIKQHTRNYAKRQMTYFNRLDNKTVFDISTDTPDSLFEKASAIGNLLILFMGCDFEYIPPVWPEEHGKQQKQMHFNFQVDDLPSAVEEAIRLGAAKAAAQYGGEHFVTMIDPEGHPFCLCRK